MNHVMRGVVQTNKERENLQQTGTTMNIHFSPPFSPFHTAITVM